MFQDWICPIQIWWCSACDTALGEIHSGEGVFGLRRGLALAGANTVIMSLWKVPDEVTQLLMKYFYEALLEGYSKVDALHIAQRKVREQYPNPYFWGTFVCQGNPGPLLDRKRLRNS